MIDRRAHNKRQLATRNKAPLVPRVASFRAQVPGVMYEQKIGYIVDLPEVSTIAGGLAAIPAIVASMYAFYRWSYNRGHKSAISDESRKRRQEAFENVYAPLRAKLINTHFIIGVGILYPTFRQRLSNAIKAASIQVGFVSKIRVFKAALSDKGESSSVECETTFPQTEIKRIVETYPHYADSELVDRVHEVEVMSSTPWEYDQDELTRKQHSLSEYIYKKYEQIEEQIHNKK